jgi:hypothetical protein
MRRCRIGCGKQLVEPVPGRRTFSDRVVTVLDIRDSLENQISAGQRIDANVPVTLMPSS